MRGNKFAARFKHRGH